MPQLRCCKRAERPQARPLPVRLPVLEPEPQVVEPEFRRPAELWRLPVGAESAAESVPESGAIETGVAESASPAPGFSSHSLFSALRLPLSANSRPTLMQFAPGTRCRAIENKKA